MAQRTIGPFIIDRQIGVGGMGIVYSAIYPVNGKKVALKVLAPGLMSDEKLMKRFEREIDILKRLDHPNIVKYYGGGTENNQRYYAMEFIDGGSLQQVLKRRTRLSWEQAIHVGRQVSSALEHAHNAGVIHRDLKPANLFLSRKGRLKLGDFGIARDTEATALTAAGKTVGTYAYMAPEQIQVGPPITGKTDLYALGCLLYEVLVGETPFQSENPMDMLMQHLNDDPYNVIEKVPDCPIWLDQLVERLLAKNPDDRPHDALAVHTELGEIREKVEAGNSVTMAETMQGNRISTKTERDKKPARKKKKKKKDVPFHEQTWFLATCLLALLSATIWLLWPKSESWYAEQWRTAMSGDEYAQRATLETHVDKYLTEFPEGEYVVEARQLSDNLHANILELQLKNFAKMGKDVEPEFKAACVDVVSQESDEGLKYFSSWETAKDVDLQVNPLPVMERWYVLIYESRSIKNPDDETRQLIQVCHNHYEYFRGRLLASPRAFEFMQKRMQDTEKRLADGEREPALITWKFVYDEFKQVESMKAFAEYARKRFNLSPAEIPNGGTAENSPDAQESNAAQDTTAESGAPPASQQQ
ncbi:MAG: serine/threonine-protein kinase [Fuerstiella sp.]